MRHLAEQFAIYLVSRFIYCYAECHYAEGPYAECKCALCLSVRFCLSLNVCLCLSFIVAGTNVLELLTAIIHECS